MSEKALIVVVVIVVALAVIGSGKRADQNVPNNAQQNSAAAQTQANRGEDTATHTNTLCLTSAGDDLARRLECRKAQSDVNAPYIPSPHEQPSQGVVEHTEIEAVCGDIGDPHSGPSSTERRDACVSAQQTSRPDPPVPERRQNEKVESLPLQSSDNSSVLPLAFSGKDSGKSEASSSLLEPQVDVQPLPTAQPQNLALVLVLPRSDNRRDTVRIIQRLISSFELNPLSNEQRRRLLSGEVSQEVTLYPFTNELKREEAKRWLRENGVEL